MGFNFQKVDESNIWPTKQSNFTRPENRVQNKTIRDQISEKRQKRTYGHLEQVDGDILFLKKTDTCGAKEFGSRVSEFPDNFADSYQVSDHTKNQRTFLGLDGLPKCRHGADLLRRQKWKVFLERPKVNQKPR